MAIKLKTRRAYLYPNLSISHPPGYEYNAETIIQQYINRWEIEVNHRDKKNNLGLGQAQVWNEQSVIKQPALLIAAYSIMLLASLKCYGYERTDNYLPQPKWRKVSVSPSCNDLVNQMRKELITATRLQNTLDGVFPQDRNPALHGKSPRPLLSEGYILHCLPRQALRYL
ncbi:MAG: hypothetical protein RBS43_05105 [Candidatus Cloacimonas sp.]|jgi:hypothetical protein|nr:hypothetical protein [Candidatus Cloacimonas sp.]